MTKKTLKLSIIAIVLLAAYLLFPSSSPTLSPIPSDGIILAFGDSLTKGYGTTEDNSYPMVLDRWLSQKVINDGISGETTSQGLARFGASLDKYQPNLVILIEGGNDILRKQDLNKTKNNLSQMIQMSLSRDIQIVLLAVPDKNLTLSPPELYHELAEEFGLVMNDDVLSDLMIRRELKSDQIHFNQEGYKKLAEKIFELLVSAGAVVIPE